MAHPCTKMAQPSLCSLQKKGDRSCSRSISGPTNVCKPEVAPASSVCSSCLKGQLSQAMVAVVPSKATGGHAQNTHCTYAISCLCSKAEIEVSKTPKGLKNGLTAAHVAPEHVLGTVCLLTAFQAHYRAERRAFPECRVMGLRGASLRAPQMAGSVSW